MRYITFFILLIATGASAQYEPQYNVWNFGDGYRLDFNTLPPVLSKTSAILSGASTASICDAGGNLLFYSNGEKVWDRTNQVMPNGSGLLGDIGSFQGVIITPFPGNREKYYLFYTDGPAAKHWVGPKGKWDGLHYAVVDMRLRGGLGDIIIKNIGLADSMSGKVTAIMASDSLGLWVLADKHYKNHVYAWYLDCYGNVSQPIVTSLPGQISAIGQFKPTFDGKELLLIHEGLQLLTFNSSTGQTSFKEQILPIWQNGYGVGISANDSFYYSTYQQSYNTVPRYLVRFDRNATLISLSVDTIYTYGLNDSKGGFETGNDGAIYGGKFVCNTIPCHFAIDKISIPAGINPIFYNEFFASFNSYGVGFNNRMNRWPEDYAIADMVKCGGDTVEIGMPKKHGFSYRWYPNQWISNDTLPDPVAWPPVTTTYTVVAAKGGCTDTAEVKVEVEEATLSGPAAVCFGDTALLIASGGQVQQWSLNGVVLPDTADTLHAAVSGTYSAILQNPCGWVDTAFHTLTVSSLPVVSIQPDTFVFCQGSQQVIHATVSGDVTFAWKRNGQLLNNQTSDSLLVSQAGLYQLVVADTCGWKDSASATVLVRPLPNATIIPSGPVNLCQGMDTLLQAAGGIAFQWQLNGNTVNHPWDTISVAQAGAWAAIVTDSFGCADLASVTVNAVAWPVAIAPPDDAICLGDSMILNATAGGSVVWSPAAGLSNAFVANPVAAPVSTTVFTIHVTDPTGACTSLDSVTITVNPRPGAALLPAQSFGLCQGADSLLAASGNGSFSWFWNGSLLPAEVNPTLVVSDPGVYMVRVENTFGCVDTASVRVNGLALPAVDAGSDLEICQGDTVILNGLAQGSYYWRPGGLLSDSLILNPVASPPAATWFVLHATAANGCTAADSMLLGVHPNPVAAFTADPLLGKAPLQVSIINQSSGASTYQWLLNGQFYANSAEPAFSFDAHGHYRITLIAGTVEGCTDTAEAEIMVDGYGKCLFVPSAFSPNDDWVNDLMLPVLLCPVNNYHFQIFSRWGNLLWETTDPNTGWDGLYKGKPVELGSYMWQITGHWMDGQPILYKGYVVVMW